MEHIKTTKVSGIKRNKILVFALSTCIWCRKTKKLLSSLGMEYEFVDVDLLEGKDKEAAVQILSKWNPDHSFPTIIIDDTRCIRGFDEEEIKALAAEE